MATEVTRVRDGGGTHLTEVWNGACIIQDVGQVDVGGGEQVDLVFAVELAAEEAREVLLLHDAHRELLARREALRVHLPVLPADLTYRETHNTLRLCSSFGNPLTQHEGQAIMCFT